VITIVSSTAVVQASGIANSRGMLQFGGATETTTVVAKGGFDSSSDIIASGPFSIGNNVLQFGGINQTTKMLQRSSDEISTGVQFIVYFPDFARGVNLFGVIGTAETVEKFFDRGPFFFTSHETDPNTLRNISEAQQFLLFSQTSIASFDNFRSTVSTAQVISAKGDLFPENQLNPVNVVNNGSFEQAFSQWTTATGIGTDIVESRTSQPTGVGFNDGSPLSPSVGTFWAHLGALGTANQLYIKQSIPFTSAAGSIPSSDLIGFSFQAIFNSINSSRLFQANLIFYLNNVVRRNLIYRVSGMGTPTIPTAANVTPSTTYSLTVTEDVRNTISRSLQNDLALESFNFDRADIWFIVDNTTTTPPTTHLLLDDVQLTINEIPSNLARTSDFAHVITTNPTSSGFPFTVSGSDNILQVDLSPPFFDELVPNSGTTFNPTTTPVEFHIKDRSSALDQGSISVYIDGTQVVAGGTVTGNSPWSAGIKQILALNDIQYTFTRSTPFPQQSTVTVSGNFADFAAVSNGAIQAYQFQILGSGSLNATISGGADSTPPTITATNPAPSATNISPNTAINWTTADNAAGVNPLLTRLLINGLTVLQNDVAANGTFSRTVNPNLGFDYTYTPNSPFHFGETVTGTIIAGDYSLTGPNTGTLTYNFHITSSDSLAITNFFMNTGESLLLTSGTIASVDVIDFTYGVADSATTITVDGVTPPGLVVTVTGSGPGLVRFQFPLKPVVTFREDIDIFVHAENKFPGAYPVIKEQTFILRPGYDVFWPNKNNTPAGGPEILLPYITNIPVLVDVKNFANVFNEETAFYRFLTDNLSHKDLGATLVSNIKIADLPASLNVLNTFFEYGKTITLEVEVADLVGNQLSFTHTFTIEDVP
jgi:hypothetical protein